MDDQKLRGDLEEWLDGFPWQWFATLTFRPGLKVQQCRWRLRQWIEEIRKALGTGNFGWVAVPEAGRTGLDYHYHVLIGGLREVAALTGFSEGTLRHWVSQRRIPVVRLSARCVRFRISDIQEWLAAQLVTPVEVERHKEKKW